MKTLKDNYGRPRSEYTDKIKSMSDDALRDECKERLWLSAYANNNPRADYHWQVDELYSECSNRGKYEIYSQAYKMLEAELK